ncbi:fork head domain-containing protein [Lipomyces chichibuensis]|uniref:fork head domain-containing protein n=1 Tax=Lipomyces chichibuensis TaxID=1546026 RepID=UPI003342F021
MLPSAPVSLPSQQSTRSPSKLARRSATVPSAPVTLRAPGQPSSQNMMRSLSSVHLPPPPLTSIAVNIAQSRPQSAGHIASQNAPNSNFNSATSPVKRQTSTTAPGTRQLSSTAAAAQHIFSTPSLATLAVSAYNSASSSSSKENVCPDAPNPSAEIPPPHLMPPVYDDGDKPPFSYATLIGMAILRAPNRRLTLSQIYKWINDSFAWYRKCDAGWQNSIRHNLSLNKAFSKQERPKDDPGKGNYWIVEPGCEYLFMKGRPRKSNTVNNVIQKTSSTSSSSDGGPDASSSPTLGRANPSNSIEQASQGSATPSPHRVSQELPSQVGLPSNESVRRPQKRTLDDHSAVDDMPWSSPEILAKRARDDKKVHNDALKYEFATPLRPASRTAMSSTISTSSQGVPGLSFTTSSSPASMMPLTPANPNPYSLLPASSIIQKKPNTNASRNKVKSIETIAKQQKQAKSMYGQIPASAYPMKSTVPLSAESTTAHYSTDTDADEDDEYYDDRTDPDYQDVSASSAVYGGNPAESADPLTKSNCTAAHLFNSNFPNMLPEQNDDTSYYLFGSSPNRDQVQLHLHNSIVQQSPPWAQSALDSLANPFSPLQGPTGTTKISSPFGSPIYIRQHQQFLSPQRKLLAQSLQFDEPGTPITSGSGAILLTDEDDEISRACFGSPEKRSKQERPQFYFDDFWPLESSLERRGSGVVSKRAGDGSVANVFGVDVCQVVKRAMMINRQKLEIYEAGENQSLDTNEDGAGKTVSEEDVVSDVRPQPLFRNMTF